jgi:hypothetical protein
MSASNARRRRSPRGHSAGALRGTSWPWSWTALNAVPATRELIRDRDSKVLGHHPVRWCERPVVEVPQAVVGAVGLDERLDVLECPTELPGSDDEVHGGIVSGPGDTPARARLALYQDSSISPRFLPTRFCAVPCPCTGGR